MSALNNWTVSKYKKYVTCPRQFGEVTVKRNFSETFPADQQRWGDEVHRAMQYAVMHGMPLPSSMKQYQPVIDQVKRAPGTKVAELRLAIDRSRGPCDYNAAGWWHRGMLDLVILRHRTAVILDWKTGKRKDDREQLMTNALLVFAHHEAIDTIVSSYIWLASGESSKVTFTRDQIPAYWNELNPTLEAIEWSMKNDVYPERPSGLCRGWCPVTTCPHWAPKPPGK